MCGEAGYDCPKIPLELFHTHIKDGGLGCLVFLLLSRSSRLFSQDAFGLLQCQMNQLCRVNAAAVTNG
ncbi:hypothetical protein E2320_008668 [Naja naja]|nr:hypothetical protein E2320_008668 [Naja naja]